MRHFQVTYRDELNATVLVNVTAPSALRARQQAFLSVADRLTGTLRFVSLLELSAPGGEALHRRGRMARTGRAHAVSAEIGRSQGLPSLCGMEPHRPDVTTPGEWLWTDEPVDCRVCRARPPV